MRNKTVPCFVAIACLLNAEQQQPAATAPGVAPQADFHETLKARLDPRLPPYKKVPSRLSGVIRAAGADTVETLVQYWIEGFTKIYPGIQVKMDAKTVTPGVNALVDGSADIVPIAREPLPKETIAYNQKFGHPPLAIEVGGGAFRIPGKSPAVVFYVNKANPVEKVTLAQLDAIISGARKRGYKEDILTWGQLGATGDFANARIHVYGIKRPNGIPHYIEMRVSLGGEFRDSTRELTSDGNTRVLYKVAQSVAEDPYGIGYGSLVHVDTVKAHAKVLALAEQENSPYYQPTFQNVLNRLYPLARPIYIYLNQESGRPIDQNTREFIKYALSKEGQGAVVREGLLLPLSAGAATRERAKLK